MIAVTTHRKDAQKMAMIITEVSIGMAEKRVTIPLSKFLLTMVTMVALLYPFAYELKEPTKKIKPYEKSLEY